MSTSLPQKRPQSESDFAQLINKDCSVAFDGGHFGVSFEDGVFVVENENEAPVATVAEFATASDVVGFFNGLTADSWKSAVVTFYE